MAGRTARVTAIAALSLALLLLSTRPARGRAARPRRRLACGQRPEVPTASFGATRVRFLV
jgi:hypothetical protein